MVCSLTSQKTASALSTADLSAIRHLVADAAATVLAADAAPDVAIVASELVTNALEHGDGGPVEVEYGPTFDGFRLWVGSASTGVPVTSDVRIPNNRTRGRGLQIVSALADSVTISSEHGNISVLCHFDAR